MKLIILAVAVSVLFGLECAEGRLNGRKLRQGEPCDEPGFFGDADDCRTFYRCAEHETEVKGMPLYAKFTFMCPVGTAFDDSLVTCNYPHNVQNLPPNCPTEAPAPPPSQDMNVQPTPAPGGQPEMNNQIGNQGQVSASGSGQDRIVVNPFQSVYFPHLYFPTSNLQLVYFQKK